MSVFVVSECGVNFNGDRSKIPAFIEASKAAGADACKWQAFNADALIKRRGITDQNTIGLLRRCELSDADLDAIAAHCKSIGLKWFASVFDPSQIERVLSRGAYALKIGHAESNWWPLLAACKERQQDHPIDRGVHIPLWISGGPLGNVWGSWQYPAKEKPNFRWLREAHHLEHWGFSSHYTDYRIPAAAALCGAKYIECHLRLSDADPEAAWSLSPEDFGKMVKLIREYSSWL